MPQDELSAATKAKLEILDQIKAEAGEINNRLGKVEDRLKAIEGQVELCNLRLGGIYRAIPGTVKPDEGKQKRRPG